MLGWVATNMFGPSESIPFSVGAGSAATPNMARALGLNQTNANYFLGGSANDIADVVDDQTAWKSAMHSVQWHHLAVTDDGSTVAIYLDGRIVGTRLIKDTSRNTQMGFWWEAGLTTIVILRVGCLESSFTRRH
eukprot:m.407517 g.407517  ORF g.407517 m.407517 type:complete len:134 (-) comp16798_c0_seq17:163-564(-)